MSIEDPNSIQPRRHSVLWVSLILAFGVVGADQVYRIYVHRQLQNQLALLRREGYPTDSFALQRWRPAVPDQENAALRILEAADNRALPANSYNPDRWPGRAEELGPAERDELSEMLTNNAAALEAVHQAGQLKQSRFPIDYSRGPNTLLPHLAKIKSLAQLLKAETMIDSEEGQTDKAVRSVLDGVALARSLDQEPILISQLVRIACLAITSSSLERLLTQHALTEPQLTELIASFRGAREVSAAACEGGFVGEICLGVYCFRTSPAELSQVFDENSGGAPVVRVLYPLYAWTGLRDRDSLFYLRKMHEMLTTTKSPFPERLAQAKELGDSTEHAISTDKLLVFSKMLLPALQKSTEKAVESEARLRCAEAALILERSRVRNAGAIPTDMAHWSGEKLPVDPIDGAPLHFRQLSPGYKFYSIGLDRTDDGGAERGGLGSSGARKWPLSRKEGSAEPGAARSRTGSYDIVFAVER